MKYLTIDINTEHDSVVAVIEWDANLAQSILSRYAILEKLCEEDPSIVSMSYYGSLKLFEWRNSDDAIEDDERKWRLLDELPEMGEEIRLSLVHLNVTKFGSVYWSTLPKHAYETYETTGISVSDAELFS